MEELKITYSADNLEFTSEDLKTISFLSGQKEVLKKITNKAIKQLTIDLLNKEVSPDFIKGYERAINSFLNNFKTK